MEASTHQTLVQSAIPTPFHGVFQDIPVVRWYIRVENLLDIRTVTLQPVVEARPVDVRIPLLAPLAPGGFLLVCATEARLGPDVHPFAAVEGLEELSVDFLFAHWTSGCDRNVVIWDVEG
jgi:hypothetical protein